MRAHNFNGGRLIVNADTITIRRIAGSESIQKYRITAIRYQYDNLLYKLVRIPLGIFYVGLIIGIPIGIRCLRGDVLAHVTMTNGETISFWIWGNNLQDFKSVL